MSGNVSGAITEAPPNKDTIAIPVGGYVVVRFRANNPGKCTLKTHLASVLSHYKICCICKGMVLMGIGKYNVLCFNK